MPKRISARALLPSLRLRGRGEADLLLVSRGEGVPYLHHKQPIFVEKFPIAVDFAALAHVADHTPVDRALVLAPGIGIPPPKRHMHRPADLLVKQDAPG